MMWISFFLGIISFGLEYYFISYNIWDKWAILFFFLSYFFSYFFFIGIVKNDPEIEAYISNSFLKHSLFIGIFPIIGWLFYLLGGLTLKFLVYKSIAYNEYQTITDFWLNFYTRKIYSYKVHKFTPLDIFHNRISLVESHWILEKLRVMEWSPYKTKILSLLIEYSKYSSVIIEASRILINKKNQILKIIAEIENQKYLTNEELLKLAQLYHEIYYLSLASPPIDKLYLKKATTYLEEIGNISQQKTALELAVLYNLQLNDLEKAKKYLRILKEKKELAFDIQNFIERAEKEIAFKEGNKK